MKIVMEKNARASIETFESYKCRLLYHPEVKEKWKIAFNNRSDMALYEDIYVEEYIGMDSDAWLLYYITVGGCLNVASIANLSDAYVNKYSDMNAYDYEKGRGHDALRARLSALLRAGFLLRITYDYYLSPDCYGIEHASEKMSHGAALYLPTPIGTNYMNEKLGATEVVKRFTPSGRPQNVLGSAASGFAMSMLVKEAFKKPFLKVEHESGMFNDNQTFRLDAELKITDESVPENPQRSYVAFIHGYVDEDNSIPDSVREKYIRKRCDFMLRYVRKRHPESKWDKSRMANVIVMVNGKRGLEKFLTAFQSLMNSTTGIDTNSEEFREQLGHIYITSEGAIQECGSLAGALFAIRDFYVTDKETGERKLRAMHVLQKVKPFF